MSTQRWRDEYIARVSKAGLRIDVARRMLRYAATLQRLAEAQCNGDWPADNGQRPTQVCPQCERLWHPSVFRRDLCPDCRTDALARAAAAAEGWTITTQGDPRGLVLRLVTPDGTEIGVPA